MSAPLLEQRWIETVTLNEYQPSRLERLAPTDALKSEFDHGTNPAVGVLRQRFIYSSASEQSKFKSGLRATISAQTTKFDVRSEGVNGGLVAGERLQKAPHKQVADNSAALRNC